MKSNTVKNIAAAMLATTTLLFSANAAEKKATPVQATTNSADLQVKYMGESDGYVFMKITLGQAAAQKANIVISDLNGERLFEETVSTKDYTRIIKVSPEELKGLVVNFVSNDNKTSKSFTINTNVTRSYNVTEVAE